MYRWGVAQLVRYGYRRLVEGHPELLFRLAADDIHFQFPGISSFAADTWDKAALRRWMGRFISLSPEFTVLDVVVTGMPWNTRVAVRFSDAIGDFYRNDGVEYLRLRWGRVQEIRVFLDTEAVTAWETRYPEAAHSISA